jgi:hypothetical protein
MRFAPSQIVSVTEALERLSPMLIMFQLLVLGAFWQPFWLGSILALVSGGYRAQATISILSVRHRHLFFRFGLKCYLEQGPLRFQVWVGNL